MSTLKRDHAVEQLEEDLRKRVAKCRARILVPEAFSPVVLAAVRAYVDDFGGTVTLLGDQSEIRSCAREIDWPIAGSDVDLVECRASRDRLVEVGTDLLGGAEVDGMVAGAVFTSSTVLGPALKHLRVPGSWVSEAVVLITLTGRIISFADTAVTLNPSAEQLATIALNTAGFFQDLVHQEPKVALLSYSTRSISNDPSVLKIQRAVEIARTRDSSLEIDGEMQFDCAFDARAGSLKAPNSPVAGSANVFVFPDLHSANIGYKIAEHLGQSTFFSVFSTGLALPVINVSRAATTQVFVRCLATCALISALGMADLANSEDRASAKGYENAQ